MNPILPTLGSAPLLSATPLDTTAATTYTDVNGLAALRKDPNSPEAISAVAQQVEAMFLQMMLKSMRDAGQDNDTDGNEMGMYQDMFDKQIALTISQHQDLGIKALLKRQVGGTAPAAKGPGGSIGAAAAGATTANHEASPTPEQFVEHIMPSIRREAARLGVDPLGLLAQAALETGWGQRLPRNADGTSSLNFFGIKAGEEWTGARATADTVEFSHGVASQRRTAFRAYASIEESVGDFAKLLQNSPRYRDALTAGSDPQAYITSVARAGYATDPDYANKLNQILNSGALQAALRPPTAQL